MKTNFLLLLLFSVFTSCAQEQSSEKADTLLQKDKSTIYCETLDCIHANEGKTIHLTGIYHYPEKNRKEADYIVLTDGTHLTLKNPENKRLEIFTKENDNKIMEFMGIVYDKNIPRKYNIIARTSNPYMVEIFNFTIKD